jgi:hypothetical protein
MCCRGSRHVSLPSAAVLYSLPGCEKSLEQPILDGHLGVRWVSGSVQVKFVKSGTVVIVRIEVEKQICAELFDQVPQLGRFTLRDEGRTIAIGKIIKLPKSLKEGAPEAK